MFNQPISKLNRTPLGVRIARAILTGDVSHAYQMARWQPGMGFTVAECRAIAGSCRKANKDWGCSLSLAEFLKYNAA